MENLKKRIFGIVAVFVAIVALITGVLILGQSSSLSLNKGNQETIVQASMPSGAVSNSWYDYRSSTASNISGGGTLASPWLIYSGRGLAYAAYQMKIGDERYITGHYKLMNDLDMRGYYWIPMKEFRGAFDRNGKTIKNVILNDKSSDSGSFGLFDTIKGGTIKNLGLTISYSFTISGLLIIFFFVGLTILPFTVKTGCSCSFTTVELPPSEMSLFLI